MHWGPEMTPNSSRAYSSVPYQLLCMQSYNIPHPILLFENYFIAHLSKEGLKHQTINHTYLGCIMLKLWQAIMILSLTIGLLDLNIL